MKNKIATAPNIIQPKKDQTKRRRNKSGNPKRKLRKKY
jgi:hypothetical protein